MDYVTAYSRVVRYGLAPKEGVETFLDTSGRSGMYDAANNGHFALAGYLEDHDDPRHEIVNRDLSYRGNSPADYYQRILDHQDSILDLEDLNDTKEWDIKLNRKHFLSDGSEIHVMTSRNPRKAKTAVWLKWTPKAAPGVDSANSFAGHFTPEEAHSILSRLSEHTQG